MPGIEEVEHAEGEGAAHSERTLPQSDEFLDGESARAYDRTNGADAEIATVVRNDDESRSTREDTMASPRSKETKICPLEDTDDFIRTKHGQTHTTAFIVS